MICIQIRYPDIGDLILPLHLHLIFLVPSRYPHWDQISLLQQKLCDWLAIAANQLLSTVSTCQVCSHQKYYYCYGLVSLFLCWGRGHLWCLSVRSKLRRRLAMTVSLWMREWSNEWCTVMYSHKSKQDDDFGVQMLYGLCLHQQKIQTQCEPDYLQM